jgi:hypothetical protein
MEDLLKHCKTLIEEDNLEELQTVIQDHWEEKFPWEYLYQKLYLHACLKKKHRIVEWMKTLYQLLDPIQQIGLRQMFSYGKYLLAK